MSTYIQANTGGRLHSAEEPSISPLNRGYLYGDAIYEVWRTYHGVVFAWEEHWHRLERSASALHFSLPFSADEILSEIRKTVTEFRRCTHVEGDVYIRLQITRGGGAIGLDTALADRPDFVLLVQENKAYSEEKMRTGLRLALARELRRNHPDCLNPAWKTGNYLNNILCLREARLRGADEVVITNLAGHLTEAAVSNIAFVRSGEILTPPLSAGILGGITRELLVEKIAASIGVTVREALLRPDDLGTVDECFLLSTTKDLTPVSSIDDWKFRIGAGTIFERLKGAFATYTKASAKNNPGLRLF